MLFAILHEITPDLFYKLELRSNRKCQYLTKFNLPRDFCNLRRHHTGTFSVNYSRQLSENRQFRERTVTHTQPFVYTVFVLSKQTWIRHPGKQSRLCTSLCVLSIGDEPDSPNFLKKREWMRSWMARCEEESVYLRLLRAYFGGPRDDRELD